MSGIGAKMAGGNSATGRKQDDFYATTDTNVTEALLQEFSFDGTIHECACGTGEMAEVIKKYGYEVVATDLVDRGYGLCNIDFLSLAQPAAPIVITNPPFVIAADFIRHGVGELKLECMALLLKATYFHAESRKALFDRFPSAYVCPLLWRPDFTGQKRPVMEFAWFIWDRNNTSESRYKPLSRPATSRL